MDSYFDFGSVIDYEAWSLQLLSDAQVDALKKRHILTLLNQNNEPIGKMLMDRDGAIRVTPVNSLAEIVYINTLN